MTQTITLPDLWLLVAPCGCLDGWMRATHDGIATRPNAEAAWTDFALTKRERDRMQSQGWVVRGGEYAEWNSRENKGDCTHDPKWGIPVRQPVPSPVEKKE